MAAETDPAPWTADEHGIVVQVRLTPRGGKDAIEGVEALANGKPVLKARVRAVPEAGKANAALARLLAEACGVACADVALTAGGTARVKTMRIAGDPGALASRLAQACAGPARRARPKAKLPRRRNSRQDRERPHERRDHRWKGGRGRAAGADRGPG